MARRLRTALVGCGKVGSIHASVLSSLPESELVAHCDSQAERAFAFASRYGGIAFQDVESMLRLVRPEAVFLCTPHPLHAWPAILAAEAGAHVMVEKPMAASLEDCDRMIAAARKAGVLLGVVSQRRFYEPVRRVKEAIEAGKIGEPALGVFQMFSWRDEAYYRSDPWRGRWDTEGGGVLINQSPHMIDLLRWFLGDVAEVGGAWANLNHPTVAVEDTAVATLRFRSGGLGSIVASLSQKPGLYTKVHVHGSNGASIGVETDRGATFIAGVTAIAEPPVTDLWTVPGEEDLLASFQREDRAAFAAVDSTTHYHALQIRDFLQAAIESRPPQVTGEDGRAVVEIITAVYRAQREAAVIRLPVETRRTHSERFAGPEDA
ncbi:MAG: Gfo/Idh/MocA family protein [Isosphaeraceae bacterium]